MRRHLTKPFILAFLLVPLLASSLAGPAGSLADEQDDDSAAAALHRYLASFDAIKADFVQQGERSERGQGIGQDASQGSFWLAGKAFRVETGPPISQTLVSDGESLWAWDIDLEQVIVSPMNQQADEIPLLLLAADEEEINRLFQVMQYRENGQDAYLLTPKAGPASQLARQFTLIIAAGKPTAINLVAVTGESAWIELSAVELDPKIPAKVFQLEFPEWVDVIDDRPAN